MNNAQDFANNLFLLMEETFEAQHHGLYLDEAHRSLKHSTRFLQKRHPSG